MYPNIDENDDKVVIRNWTQEATLDDFGGTSNVNIWYATNTGLVTQLYQDGRELTSLSANLDTKETETKSSTFTAAGTSTDVDTTSNMGAGDILKINNEYIQIAAVSDGDTITYSGKRNLFGTLSQGGVADDDVFLVVDESSVDFADYGWFFYDSALDMCVVAVPSDTDPNELLMEAGEDWATLIDRMIVNCSMELSAMLDARFPRPIPKSFQYAVATDGSDTPEYDYILKRTTALLVAHHQLVSKNPLSEEAIAFKEQIDDTVEKINGGNIKFAFEIDPTDTGGDITEVTRGGSMYLVETGGTWYGEAFDRVKFKCSTGGVYGTAKVDVSYYGDAKLYGSTITGVIVSGALTDMLLGLAVRFEGNAMNVNDEWHVTVRDFRETSTNAGVRSIESTSGNRINKVVYKKGIEV